MLKFVIMNMFVCLSAYFGAFYILRIKNTLDRLLSVFILFLAQVAFTETALGIMEKLYLDKLIFLNLAIFALVILFVEIRGCKKVQSQIVPNPWQVQDRFSRFVLSVLCGFVLIRLVNNIINPPLGWDSLNYHFTFPVEWLKHGNLSTPITICDDPTPTYYPINGGLFYLWLIFPFKSVFLANIGQFPFFFFAFIAVYNIGLKTGLDEKMAFIAAALFSVVPNYFRQLEFGYSDIMVASLFLIALNFLLSLENEFKLKNLLLASISLGLLLGTKTVSLPYACVLFIFMAIIFGGQIFKRNIKIVFGYFFTLVLFLFIFGGFGYIRNFLLTGNPLYPLDFKVFGKTVFNGVMAATTYRAHWSQYDYNLSKLFFHEGMGLQFIILFIPGILLALPVAFIKERRILTIKKVFIYLLPILLYLVFRYLIPQLWVRFLYPFLGVSAIVALHTMRNLKIPKKVIKILSLICILASFPEMARQLPLINSLILSSVVYLSILLTLQSKVRPSKLGIIIAALIIITVLNFVWIRYEKEEYPRYVTKTRYWPEATLGWKWLNENTESDKIAYTGRPVPFPLYGTNFKNDVYYVSINKLDPQLHNYKNGRLDWNKDFHSIHTVLSREGNYRSGADYQAWLDNLRKKNTSYLFVYVLHETQDFPIEDEWAKKNPKLFAPVFLNKGVHIYKFLK